MTKPQVSIIMATYNRSTFINEALEAIKKQTFKNWECIIIDDGSKDNTEQTISNIIYNDDRFRYLKRTSEFKKGLPGSRNMGLSYSEGDYIIFFDDDDLAHPQNLEICLNILDRKGGSFCRYDKQPFTGKFSFQFKSIDVDNIDTYPFKLSDIDRMITGELPFASCGVMWKKECFRKNKFDEELMYAEEWECYTRILLSGIEGNSLNEILYYNRKHSKSNTGEFYNKNFIRKQSYLKAINLVLGHLNRKNLISQTLELYFIRLGFFLNEYSVIDQTLKKTDANRLKRFKYLSGYKFYPIIRPFFLFKKKVKDYLN